MTHATNVWFITGVSRGFGKVLAETLLAGGATVIGTTRSGSAQIDPAQGRLTILPLEVTDPRAVRQAIDARSGSGGSTSSSTMPATDYSAPWKRRRKRTSP
ncbi:MAG: hypothetical protein ACP5PN_06595, partial [Steroidobacteraceae bacterium]